MPSANPCFKTKAEALSAGFVPAADHRAVEVYREIKIMMVDRSGPHSFGYRYKFTLTSDLIFYPESPSRTELEIIGFICKAGDFSSTVEVWFTDELNRMREPGCFAPMFSPDAWAEGLEAARTAINAFYAGNEGARAWEQEQIAQREARAARAHERAVARAETLAAKYGKENITNPHYKALLD